MRAAKRANVLKLLLIQNVMRGTHCFFNYNKKLSQIWCQNCKFADHFIGMGKNQNDKKHLSLEEKWENLTFANNFLFCRILESEPEICRRLLELLLHIKIEKLEPPQAERTMQEGLDSKSVRFDVYVKGEDRVFDIEMQTATKRNLRKRARYYQSMIDMDCLLHGEDYEHLKDSYVIFICLEDLFGKGLPAYFFENICRQVGKMRLDDGAYKIFFNASEYDKIENAEEKAFFKFLLGNSADDDFTRTIAEKVSRAKKSAALRRLYMTWEREIKHQRYEAFDEGREEGLSIGREEGLSIGRNEGARQKAIEAAKVFLADGRYTLEEIAKMLDIPEEELRAEIGAEVSAG
jgi:predicted transposase/invertase (TIGR01784 family)